MFRSGCFQIFIKRPSTIFFLKKFTLDITNHSSGSLTQCHQQLSSQRSDRQQGSDHKCPTYIQGDQHGHKQDQGGDNYSPHDILILVLLFCTIQIQIPSYQ